MRTKKRLFCVLVALMVAFTSVTVYADVDQKDIDEAKEQINNLQNQLNDVNNTISNLSEQKKTIQANMDSYTAKIDALGSDISMTLEDIEEVEKAIEELKGQIEQLEEEIDEIQLLSDTQYEAMKKRIAYMYEHKADDLLVSIFSAGSISGMLSRANYIQSINSYDRTALNEYAATMDELNGVKDEVNETKVQMEDTQKQLEEKKKELESQKSKFGGLLAGSKTDLENTNNSIDSAEMTADELEKQIAEMKKYEAQLEIQKAMEDLARMQELQEWENESWDNGPYDASDEEKAIFAALIQCEAGGEGEVGQMAVASVVMNRVASSRFPGSVYGVIFQGGQFSPVASGRLATVLGQGPNEKCFKIAERALDGERNITALFFRTVASAQAAGFDFETGVIIGNHYFYPVK